MNTTAKGDLLEDAIHRLFQTEIASSRFWARPDCCKLFRKKGYFSRDRASNIVFDVSIEIFLPGADDCSFVVLVECKNYSHSVPVDDVEEFFSKVSQVAGANSKAILATTAAFQAGAREYAKAKGIGLLRYFAQEDFKWELKRSPAFYSGGGEAECHAIAGLVQPEFRSEVYDLYLQSPTRATNSFSVLMDDLFAAQLNSEPQLRSVKADVAASEVPYLSKVDLNSVSANVLAEIGYEGGMVPLEAIGAREHKRTGLTLEFEEGGSARLGSAQFYPPRITIWRGAHDNLGRLRFTWAHELSHHLLDHGRFLRREYCDETDFTASSPRIENDSDVQRLEYQANYLAACLLMPEPHFLNDFFTELWRQGISDKGFGALFVDRQACNLESYRLVTDSLKRRYLVSREAIRIRLQAFGLLVDVRSQIPTPSAK